MSALSRTAQLPSGIPGGFELLAAFKQHGEICRLRWSSPQMSSARLPESATRTRRSADCPVNLDAAVDAGGHLIGSIQLRHVAVVADADWHLTESHCRDPPMC
jgi:hypothetical protein